MQAIESLLFAIAAVFLFIHLINAAYLFQIKEYRLDRFWVFLQETGVWEALYVPHFRVPALKKPRNLMHLLLGSILVSTLLYALPHTLLSAFVLAIIAPLLATITLGAACILTSIPVNSYRSWVIRKASKYIRTLPVVAIGITGSYGKSTVKEYTAQLVSKAFPTARTYRNQNTDIGVALAILRNLTPETQYFVAEMGAYRKGEIAAIARMVGPHIGIITALGNQHVALFGSKQALVEGKGELAESLPQHGALFIPTTLTHAQKNYLKHHTVATVYEFEGVPHDPHAHALSAATAVARYLGIPEALIAQTIPQLIKPSHIRPLVHPLGYTVINASYSSNLEGFIAHLHALAHIHAAKKIIVTTGIPELGSERKNSYQTLLSHIPSHAHLYTTDRMLYELGRHHKAFHLHYFRLQAQLFPAVQQVLSADCALLLEGRARESYIHSLLT